MGTIAQRGIPFVAHQQTVDHTGRTASKLLALASLYGNIAPVPEIARFATGHKPVLRLVIPVDAQSRCSEILESVQLKYAFRSLRVRATSGTWAQIAQPDSVDYSSEIFAVYVSRSSEQAAEAADADINDGDAAGRLFGYPACCIAAVDDLSLAGSRWPSVLVERSGRPECWHAAANRLVADWGAIPPVGELFPCSLGCPQAIQLGIDGMNALHTLGLHRIAEAIRYGATRGWMLTGEGRAVPSTEAHAYKMQWP